jgi:hypothetical protein
VTEVDYDAVRDMRLAWLSDDYGDGEFEASQIWICADDEGRPKHLYERLGFRPAWTMFEFMRRDR